MGVLVEVIDSRSVETASTAFKTMHLIALAQQELSEVAAVLACDPSDQGNFSGQLGGQQISGR